MQRRAVPREPCQCGAEAQDTMLEPKPMPLVDFGLGEIFNSPHYPSQFESALPT